MIWSPLSNLLLYGQTADVADAKTAGTTDQPFKIGLGSDSTPSGSKSLFGELKVARVYSQNNGSVFSDEGTPPPREHQRGPHPEMGQARRLN